MCLLPGAAMTANGAAQPNVVMIMADDWGWSDLAAYRRYQGLSDPIPTPNLDRLISEGMMFTDAHSPAALCAPTRFSMMTGSYPYRNTVQWGTWGFLNTSAFSVNRRHVTVGEVMQAAGYRTAFFGKMHFGGGSTNYTSKMPNFPTTYGFDYTFCTHGGIQDAPYLYFENDRFVKIDPASPLNPSALGTLSDLKEWPSGSYTITNGTGNIQAAPHNGTGDVNWNSSQNGIINSGKAVGFIRNHLANYPDRPFMVYYCAPQIHVPHTPPIDFEPDALGVPGNPVNRPVAGSTAGNEWADMVYELDLQVGKIIAGLEDPNGDGNTSDSILANTLVMFTSDNGGVGNDYGITGYDSTGPLTGFKAMMEEGGHRVPFVAHWGDGTPAGSTVAPGTVSHQLICTHDWVGTMYALTGQSIPSDQAMDCVNLLPVLRGEQNEAVPVRNFLILQSQDSKAYPYAIRQGDYVLFLDGSKNIGPLYNLATDLAQTNNLLAGTPSADNISRSSAMRTTYLQYDNAVDPRSTTAYTVPDITPPLPNPAGFSTAPTAIGPFSASMTAITGSDVSTPVEYLFSEISGNWGGASSSWQTNPIYIQTNLLQETRYAYTVMMRDALGHIGKASEALAVIPSFPATPTLIPFFTENFSMLPSQAPSNSAPASETWFLPLNPAGTSPQRIDESSAGSVLVKDGELITGFGGDRVSIRWYSNRTFDLSQDYRLMGDWIVDSTFAETNYTLNERGFRAGLARFSSTGAIIGEGDSRTAPDLQFIKWAHVSPSSPVTGNSGHFSLTVTAEELATAGVTATDHVGIVIYRNSDNWPTSGGANEMYRLDNLALGFADDDGDGLPNRFELANGLDPNDPEDAYADFDSDGVNNLQEYIENTNFKNPADYFAPTISVDTSGPHTISLPDTVVGRRYRLEFSKDLGVSDPWTVAEIYTPAVSGQPYSFTHSSTNTRGFYRIRTERFP